MKNWVLIEREKDDEPGYRGSWNYVLGIYDSEKEAQEFLEEVFNECSDKGNGFICYDYGTKNDWTSYYIKECTEKMIEEIKENIRKSKGWSYKLWKY